MNKFSSIAIAALMVCFPSIRADAANMQQQNHVRAQPSSTISQQASTRCQYEFQSQKLTQMVELPEVPQYTGQMTFVAGTYFPNARSGASYTMKVRTLEYPSAVKDWYSAALQQSGWKVEQAMCNERTVAAWKGKQLVQVIVNEPSHDRFRADVLIRYRCGG